MGGLLAKEGYGIVKFTSNDDREAILKSCLYGFVLNVYIRNYCGKFSTNDGTVAQLDRISCLSTYSRFVVGIPKTIEYITRFGWTDSLNLITFASEIDVNTLLKLVHDSIVEETKLCYSKSQDAVEVTITRSFAGIVVDNEINYYHNHPAYAQLKAKYGEIMKYYDFTANISECQEVIVIDGKQFKINYSYDKNPVVYIDNETLFSTEKRELFLYSGEKVWFRSDTQLFEWEEKTCSIKKCGRNESP